jgi:methanogenic corrinoid protein MtbC1
LTDVTRSAQSDSPGLHSGFQERQALEREIVARLLRGDTLTAANPARPMVGSEVTRADLEGFLRDVLGDSDDGALISARAMVERGVSTESIYLDLLAPTARALGDLWSDDTCDFVVVTVALGRLQGVLRQLSRVFITPASPTESTVGRILLSCIPGEQHTLGLFMVAEFMIRDGWGVSVGAPVEERELLNLVRDEWFDAIGFSVACDSRLWQLQREIRRVRAGSRNTRIAVIVGGRVFNDRPDLVRRVGADASAVDARSAPQSIRDLVLRAEEHEREAEAASDE